MDRFSNGQAINGIAYYLTTPTSLSIIFTDPLKVLIYAIVFLGSCVVFAWLWVELSGIGPKTGLQKQLHQMGMQIPGQRSSRAHFERILKRYIPGITVLGGLFVGLLAFGADLTSALGGGTGILLTVGIVYRLYEEIAQEQFDGYASNAQEILRRLKRDGYESRRNCRNSRIRKHYSFN